MLCSIPGLNIETGRLGDWETGRLGDWEIGRLGDWEIGRLGDWEKIWLSRLRTCIYTKVMRDNKGIAKIAISLGHDFATQSLKKADS